MSTFADGYEYAHVRSDDAAKWIGRDGWERDNTTVTLRRLDTRSPDEKEQP